MRKRAIFLVKNWKTEVFAYILYACSVPVVYLYGMNGSVAYAAETGVFLASGDAQAAGGVEIMRAPGLSGLDAGDGAYGAAEAAPAGGTGKVPAGGGLINGSDGSGVYADNPSQSGASGSIGPARSGAVQGKAAVPEGADRESAPVDGGVAEVRRSAAAGDGQTSFVRVTAKVKDAELQAELIRLNDELAALKAKVAGIEAERSAALAELDLVRSGLGELLEKLHDKDQQLSALQLKFAGMLDAGGRSESGKREVQLMGRYKALVDQGGALALRFTEFCKKVDSLASAMDLDEVQRAELRLTMENLSGELQKFSVALDSGSEEASFRNTRILAINRDLGLVVLPVGINHGVFNGLMMYPVGDPSTALRIISVRPNVSGAIVVSGEISRLSSGQEVRADREKTE